MQLSERSRTRIAIDRVIARRDDRAIERGARIVDERGVEQHDLEFRTSFTRTLPAPAETVAAYDLPRMTVICT